MPVSCKYWRGFMGHKTPVAQSSELFRQPLCDMLNAKFSAHFHATTGRPALSPRLVAGLLYLQHAYDRSDEAIVNTWVENLMCSTSRAKRMFRPRRLLIPQVLRVVGAVRLWRLIESINDNDIHCFLLNSVFPLHLSIHVPSQPGAAFIRPFRVSHSGPKGVYP